MISERLTTVKKSGINSAGKTNLLKHLRGERLTQRQAILAKCCDCMCYHTDGRMDCRMLRCSLYPFRPYKDDLAPPSGKAISYRRRAPATPLSDVTPPDRGMGHSEPEGGE